MEFPVGLLEGLGNPLYGLHHVQTFQQVHVNSAGVTDETQHRDLCALGNVDIQTHVFQPCYQVLNLIRGSAGFQNCDHTVIS